MAHRFSGLVAVCVLAASASSVAPAQPTSDFTAIDARLKACLDRANGVTPSVDNCNANAVKAADTILNRVYGDWVARLKNPAKDDAANSAETLKRLIASERAWITYRDTSCNLQATEMLGGTGETLVYGSCLYTTTRARVVDLKAIQRAPWGWVQDWRARKHRVSLSPIGRIR